MRLTKYHNFRLLLVLALIGALAGAGFAHRIHTQPLSHELQAYVDAGGSISDICGDVEDSSGHSASRTCEFCLLVNASALLTEDTEYLCNDLPLRAKLTFIDPINVHPFKLDQSRTARGPPND